MSETPRKTLHLPKNPVASTKGHKPLRANSAVAKRHLPPSAKPAAPISTTSTTSTTTSVPPRTRTKPPSSRTHAATHITSTATPSGVRLSKIMSERGLCSRREADAFIEQGLVWVDGKQIRELGTRIDPNAQIELDQTAQGIQKQQLTVILHKPIAYVSGQPEPGYTPAVTLIRAENQWQNNGAIRFHPSMLKGLAPAGRLDVDSSGLLILTQNGRIARQLIGENSSVDKEYLVRVEGKLDAKGLALLNHGLSLDDRQLKPALVEWLNEDQLRFVLTEGRKRQIRRMCELVGLHVVGLKRVRIGKITLGALPLGQWRALRADEGF